MKQLLDIFETPLALKAVITGTITTAVASSFGLLVTSIVLLWPWYVKVFFLACLACSITVPLFTEDELRKLMREKRGDGW